MARVPEDNMKNCFEQSYICFPFSEVSKPHLEDGNRIIMPSSALHRLVDMEIEYPMLFEIRRNNSGDGGEQEHVSHCGVLEFSAEEGFAYLPLWMMKNLRVREGELVVLKNVSLSKGTYMKIQPHKTKFIDLPDPKGVLERGLKGFACVTAGDTIMITHENIQYYIDILETKPSNAVSVVETDCSVEFAPPLDYKEPQKKPKPVVTTTFVNHNIDGPEKDQQQITAKEEPKFKAFAGAARRIDGEPVVTTTAENTNASSSLWVKESEKQSVRRNRAAGNLVFGGAEEDGSNPNPSNKPRLISSNSQVTKQKAPPKLEDKKFQPFTGKKFTLAG